MRLSVIASAIAVACVGQLSGCGGSNSGGDNAGKPPAATGDAFVKTVRQYTDTASAASDSSEPNDITNVMVTMPDNTEPETITF